MVNVVCLSFARTHHMHPVYKYKRYPGTQPQPVVSSIRMEAKKKCTQRAQNKKENHIVEGKAGRWRWRGGQKKRITGYALGKEIIIQNHVMSTQKKMQSVWNFLFLSWYLKWANTWIDNFQIPRLFLKRFSNRSIRVPPDRLFFLLTFIRYWKTTLMITLKRRPTKRNGFFSPALDIVLSNRPGRVAPFGKQMHCHFVYK